MQNEAEILGPFTGAIEEYSGFRSITPITENQGDKNSNNWECIVYRARG